MRDPHRIPRILAALQALWQRHPDLRLGQLVENLAQLPADARVIPSNAPTFYLEDDLLEERIHHIQQEGWPGVDHD